MSSPTASHDAQQPSTTPSAEDDEVNKEINFEKHNDDQEEEPKPPSYPPRRVVIPIVLSVCLAVFLVALDRTIIGVAVPTITNEFHSFSDVSWYESAYLLTYAVFQLPMGKIYTFFPAKWIFITIILIFEAGSILSAASPTSAVFIAGRAISGVGSSGMSTGGQVIFVDLLPLEKRPKYQGFIGATFGLASIAGPLVGGAFTSIGGSGEAAGWRWCFWINVPIGFVAVVLLLWLLPAKAPPAKTRKNTAAKDTTDDADGGEKKESFAQKCQRFDPLGTVLMLSGLILLLLGLQFGSDNSGSGGWSAPKVLGTLIPGIILLLAFALSQVWAGEAATVPPRIIGQRSIAASTVVSIGYGAALVLVTFYLPIWYQAVYGLSAVDSGIRMIGYFLSTVFCVIGAGVFVSKVGYSAPCAMLGTAVIMIGSGLLTKLSPSTTTAQSVGYQIVVGAGIGLTLTQPINAVQTVLAREDIPIGLTVVNFFNFVGGTIFVSVAQSILFNTLSTQVPGLDPSALSGSGATAVVDSLSPEMATAFIAAYNQGIVNIFYCTLGLASLGFVAAWFWEWRSVKAAPETEVGNES